MRTFRLLIEYDGGDFNGWQLQANTPRTVQGAIEGALSKIFRKKRVVLIGSGRTDAGVHARGQVAHFKVSTQMPAGEIMRAINHNIPPGIVIKDAREAPPGFHAQYSAISKTYSYTVLNRSFSSPIDRRFSYFFPRKLHKGLMRREAVFFLGRHDFCSFANVDRSRDCSSVRTIHRLDIKSRGDLIVITVQADGFLYKMVRNIIGVLLEVGTGRLQPGSVPAILKAKDRRFAGMAVPPQGLCLESVEY
jgi:tRNA pseudouridine38-40 synthase